MKRRSLFKSAPGAAAAGMAQWAGGFRFSSAKAAEVSVEPAMIRVSAETEPLVKLILDTPRDDCVAVIVREFRRGLPVRHLLAALYLAAIRPGLWHRSAFDHVAYVIHSAHQLALDLPPGESLLPVLWALDALKAGHPKPEPLAVRLNGPLPSPDKAADELRAGIETQNEERAARAVVALSRSAGMARTGEVLWRHAGRDFTFIGHLAILMANSWRLLQTIGWQHAEPALRYVVSGLAGVPQSKPDLAQYPENVARVAKGLSGLPANWAAPGGQPAFTRELLAAIRERNANSACDLVMARLTSGKATAGAVWDAIFLSGGEMIASVQKNGEPLHSNTVANALHAGFSESGEPSTRLLLLLQAVAWMIRFNSGLADKKWLNESIDITALTAEHNAGKTEELAAGILTTLSHGGVDHGGENASAVPGWKGGAFNNAPWRRIAAARAFALAQDENNVSVLFRSAAQLLPAKADTDPHRIKFATAMFENYHLVSPEWRPHLAAAATYSFLGADAPDTPAILRIREALGK
jgi:hypothetical protein